VRQWCKKLKILDLLVKLTNPCCYTIDLKREIFATIKANAIAPRGGEEDKRHGAVPAVRSNLFFLQ